MVRLATPAEAALAARAADSAAETRTIDWTRSLVEEGGQHHLVLIPQPEQGSPTAVARISRTSAAQLPRTTALLRSLHGLGLPFEVPLPLSDPVADDADDPDAANPDAADPNAPVSDIHRAVVVLHRYVPGQAHPPHCGRPEDLREICRMLAAVDTSALEPHLAEPFSFRGPWTPAKTAGVLELPRRLEQRSIPVSWPDFFPSCTPSRFEATVLALLERVRSWTEHPVVPPSLVHGDLAGHNMRWLPVAGEDRWRLTGILDWDLACRWDPALNPAYLSMWHGEEKLADLCLDDDEHHRARVWLAGMALESLYDAGLRLEQIAPKKWVRLLTRTLPRLERAAELLDV
ncbi:MAG: phosphotransferase family protein [Micrococcaceae bacterium]